MRPFREEGGGSFGEVRILQVFETARGYLGRGRKELRSQGTRTEDSSRVQVPQTI